MIDNGRKQKRIVVKAENTGREVETSYADPNPVGSGLFGSAGSGSEIFKTGIRGSGANENGSFVYKQAL